QPHGVFTFAKYENIRHSGHTLQRVPDVNVQVVAHKKRIVAAVGRVNGRPEYEVIGSFGGSDAGGLDGGRQPAQRGVHAVLNIDCGQVRVPVQVEGSGNLAGTVIAAGG